MVVRTISAALQGIDATPVYCETVTTQGIRTIMIGLPDTAVKESRDRIESALREAGMRFPRRAVTINLAPADVRKEGSLYDVPIAVAVMAADGKIPTDKLEQYMMVGELSLDGAVKPVKGCLPFAILARQMHLKGIIVPRENACEAAVVNNLDVLCADTLKDVMDFMAGESEMERKEMNTREMFEKAERTYPHDFKDVKGQEMVKRAFAIAAAGGHNMIMVGPPGAGKSMMAKCLPSILPPLSLSEALETTKIHSVAGLRAETGLVTQRPFRSPHHTITDVALVGGGQNPHPGEISLAHNGVLFLDELSEYRAATLEVLRQPLEDRHITVVRTKSSVDFPASFMLVAAMNPCPCGYYGANNPAHPCTCTPAQIHRYLSRISGPLLDRIDLQCEIEAVPYEQLRETAPGESSAAMRERVTNAREVQKQRFANNALIHSNAMMSTKMVRQYCALDAECDKLLEFTMTKLGLSARAYDRILKVARTIADLEGSQDIQKKHLLEAISYRSLDRSNWGG